MSQSNKHARLRPWSDVFFKAHVLNFTVAHEIYRCSEAKAYFPGSYTVRSTAVKHGAAYITRGVRHSCRLTSQPANEDSAAMYKYGCVHCYLIASCTFELETSIE